MIVGNKRGVVVVVVGGGSNNNMIDRMIGFVFDHNKIEKRNLDFAVELLGEMRSPS